LKTQTHQPKRLRTGLFTLSTQHIREQEVPPQSMEGMNDFGTRGYKRPCPKEGMHHYVFQLFALDTTLALPEGKTEEEVMSNPDDHYTFGWRNRLEKATFCHTKIQ
jgi:Phosphatidylethanolamine-binding protein